jgi:hypothetical protein
MKTRQVRKRKKISFWAQGVNAANYKYRAIMVTLTYRKAEDWQPGQIRAYIKKTKERLGKRVISYAWVMELQKRGVPHYHVLWIVRPYTRIRMPDKNGDWDYGFSNVVTNVKSVYYIISYLKKANEVTAEYPKGGRIFAVWHCDKVFKESMRRFMFPAWLKEKLVDLPEDSNIQVKRKNGKWYIGNIPVSSGWKFIAFEVEKPVDKR